MIEVKDTGIKSYHPDMDGDPLYVTKGNCHYSHEGTKDFLDYITAYQPENGGEYLPGGQGPGENPLRQSDCLPLSDVPSPGAAQAE